MSSPTKLRQMAKELGWPPELEKAADRLTELERENAALRELAARMATEMRETDHEFASLQDYDARKEAQP